MLRLFTVFLLLTHCNPCVAGWKLVEIDEVSIQTIFFKDGGHDPLITDNGLPNRGLDKAFNLNLNINLSSFLYFDNQIVSRTDSVNSSFGQFRMVGWNYRAGIRPFDFLEIGIWHFSKHVLDHSLPYHFPVEDGIEIKLILIGNGSRQSLLKFLTQ